jgi:pilus assembly protein CpaB
MRKGVVVFAVVAFALTGGTIYLVNNWLKQERARMAERSKKPIEESGVFVLVAAKNLPAGHIVAVSDLRWQSWPEKSVPQPYIVRRGGSATDVPPQYVGTVVRRGIVGGGPITGDGLIKLGERGFLAAVLRPGMRAISVRVDESTGVAGLVYPGDRVDVILTHEVSVKAMEGERERERKVRVSETVLSNVRVIAIDQSMDDIKTTKGGDVTKARIPKTATLEASTSQAEIIAVGVKMGTLTLAVRSLACSGTEAQAASAGDAPNCTETRPLDDAERGKTFTADSDVSRMTNQPGANSVQVNILRVTEKAKMNDATVTVKLPVEPSEPSQPSLPNQ